MWYMDYYDYDTYLNSDPSNMPGWETHPVPRSAWHADHSGIAMGKLMGRDVPFKILPPLEPGWQRNHRLVAVSQSDTFSLGLCSCGKVFIDGFLDWRDYERKCEMVDWEDVVAIATGPDTILALRKDGRVLAPGYRDNSPVSSWRDVVQLSAGESAMLGLRKDGTVLASGNDFVEWEVENWHDIVQVSAGDKYVLGVRSDGTVAYADIGYDEYAVDVSGWTDIVQVSAGPYHAAGLRRDGTVVVAECAMYWEFFHDVECLDMSSWTDIKQVCAGNALTVALRADGWVLMAISTGRFEGLRMESPLEAVAISINRHYEGNDEVLALDIHGHAVRELLFYEELPWDNWDEE